MLVATQGFVLHTVPYAETSVVAKIFTRLMGVRSYMIKGVRTRQARVKQNLLQPLACLDMVVYNNPRAEINYTKELALCGTPAASDAVSNAMRFFMTEVLYRTLQEGEPMPQLWEYVMQCHSDISRGAPLRDMPNRFLLRVATHLGIAPLANHSADAPLFDLADGCYVKQPSAQTLTAPLSALLYAYQCSAPTQPPTADRLALTDALVNYYKLHLPTFGRFASHEILHTLLR